MADQQKDWWKSSEETETTKRSSPDSGNYDGNGYNVGTGDDGPSNRETPRSTPSGMGDPDSSHDVDDGTTRNGHDSVDEGRSSDANSDDYDRSTAPSDNDALNNEGAGEESPYNTTPDDASDDEDDDVSDEDDTAEDIADDVDDDMNDADTDQDLDEGDADDIADEVGEGEDIPDADEDEDLSDDSDAAMVGQGGSSEDDDEMDADDDADLEDDSDDAGDSDTDGELGDDEASSDASDEESSDSYIPSPKGDGDSADSGIGYDSEDTSSDNLVRSTVAPEFDETAFPKALFDSTRYDSGASEKTDTGSNAGAGMQEQTEAVADDDGDEDVKAATKAVVATTDLKWYLLGGGLILLLVIYLMFAVSVFIGALNSDDEAAEQNGAGSGIMLDFSNHRLSADVMKHQPAVEEAMKEHGLAEEWLMVILGAIQQESGGVLEDVMQSSESQGYPVNTFNTEQSIYYGVLAFKEAVDAGYSRGIYDVRAILQGYNMGHAFLGYMAEDGQTQWTSDYAEQYSKDIVFPSVTGLPASSAQKESSQSPWAIAINKPYYYRNGGDFHYPNAVMHHLGVDYMTDDAILLEDVAQGTLPEGSLDGYIYPIPFDNLQVTSEYGYQASRGRVHHGIDMQYKGTLYHMNQPIYAAADGRVIVSGHGTSQGNYVQIEHGPPGDNDAGFAADTPIVTQYMHLHSTPAVKVGQMVKAGDVIGYEGNTGGSQGDHLHFEMLQNGQSYNPRKAYPGLPPSVL